MDLESYRHWLHDQLAYWRGRCYDEAEAKGFKRQPRYIKYASPESRATYEAIGECHDKFIDATYPDPPTLSEAE